MNADMEKNIEILTKSVEKLVKLSMENSSEINILKTKLNSIESMVSASNAHINLNSFNIQADEDLHQHLLEESLKDATDFPITKAEIDRGMVKYSR